MNVEDSLGGKIDQTLSCFNYMDKYEHALYLFIACFSYMNPLNVCVLISFLLRDLLRGFLTAVSIGGGGSSSHGNPCPARLLCGTGEHCSLRGLLPQEGGNC